MHEIRIPRLGWSMEEGTFVGWLKQPGDEVSVGDPLYELEGEKAVEAIEAIEAGKLHVPADAPTPGSVIPVGALVGFLLGAGEAPPQSARADRASEAKTAVGPSPAVAQPAASAGARAGNDVRSSSAAVATPRARRVAAELGVDWKSVSGTGRGGRVRAADIEAAGATAGAPAGGLSSRRKAIADRLRLSRERTVPVTLTTTADATRLVALREQFKAACVPHVPAYTDIVACLAAKVLEQHPRVAVRWDRQHQALIPVAAAQFHIGIAVDTPDGLLVPIVRNVLGRSPLDLAQESHALIERARAGRLTAAEMQDGVLTITNLGAFGIDAFTPVLNYPEVAILGLGAIRREPVVLPDDRIVPGLRITLSLTFDHAAIDGAPAAAFLRDLATGVTGVQSG